MVTSSDRTKIDNDWPVHELEHIESCPYCESKGRNIAYQGVQDWSFYCAPGKWTYWNCANCHALYLNPRPTKASIGRAYDTYYTHGVSSIGKMLATGKTLIRNLCYFAWYRIDLHPRFSIPKLMFPILRILRKRIASPSFILQELHNLPKGRLIDVGCGDGAYLDSAKQLGWQTLGIELDPKSAKIVEESGHKVIQGTYEALAAFKDEIDCIICSHVLEHVHVPKALLLAMSKALKMGGIVLLSMPNANSAVRSAVSDNWRGLEAPRHLAIPKYEGLLEIARLFGFEKKFSTVSKFETLDESLRIAQRRGANTPELRASVVQLQAKKNGVTEANSDFINVVLRKTFDSVQPSNIS